MKADNKEAMKLALEALEGLEALLLSMGLTHLIVYGDAEKAITSLSQAIANEALDRMAENARELGLDYELQDKDPDLIEQPAQTDWEAVAADQAMTIALLKTELQEFANKEADAVEVALTESGWVWDGDQWQRPPQTWAGLTDEEVKQCFDSVSTQDCQNYEHWRSLCARNIESKLKEKNT